MNLTDEQVRELHGIAFSLSCCCYTYYDDTAGEFITGEPCTSCRLNSLLRELAPDDRRVAL